MNKRALLAASGGIVVLAVLLAFHWVPRPPAATASVGQIKSPQAAGPAPITVQPDEPLSSEIGKPVQYRNINTIPDKEYYLYFFSPT